MSEASVQDEVATRIVQVCSLVDSEHRHICAPKYVSNLRGRIEELSQIVSDNGGTAARTDRLICLSQLFISANFTICI